ncbi:unnamed protein product [Parnassius apollo]|uniref:(apollo) hypothetical protein n=1 Tax=Parnassius apollo TaxID=110799 RepID=A0A8S3W2X2_PARAO|nr:unnamed protein product [Parnassius apollo]
MLKSRKHQIVRFTSLYFTLDITERQIRTTKEKNNENGFIAEDRRGKHTNRKIIDDTIIKDIENHINSIPRVESHYLRASTSIEFIEGGRTVKDLWRDFSEARDPNKPKVDYWLYFGILSA